MATTAILGIRARTAPEERPPPRTSGGGGFGVHRRSRRRRASPMSMSPRAGGQSTRGKRPAGTGSSPSPPSPRRSPLVPGSAPAVGRHRTVVRGAVPFLGSTRCARQSRNPSWGNHLDVVGDPGQNLPPAPGGLLRARSTPLDKVPDSVEQSVLLRPYQGQPPVQILVDQQESLLGNLLHLGGGRGQNRLPPAPGRGAPVPPATE